MMPISAHNYITMHIHENPLFENISASAVSPSPIIKLKFPTPHTLKDIRTYIIMLRTTERIIATGISFFAFLASSLMVVIKSNPKYAKNKIVDPSITPINPLSFSKN